MSGSRCLWGTLTYKGRRVDPARFRVQGKDLRRLVGRCCDCGVVLRGRAASPEADPYSAEINEDETPVVQCPECHQNRSDSI